MEKINLKELADSGVTIGDLLRCEDCGKPWASEYHMSDECVKETGE